MPNAKIATGYGLVSVTLKDGSVVAGTIARETPQSVGVRLFDGTNRTLARADYAGISALIFASTVPPVVYGLEASPALVAAYVALSAAANGACAPPDDGDVDPDAVAPRRHRYRRARWRTVRFHLGVGG